MLRNCLPRCGRGEADFVRNRLIFVATFNIIAISKATINENQVTFLKGLHLLLKEFANVLVRKWANLFVHYSSVIALAKHIEGDITVRYCLYLVRTISGSSTNSTPQLGLLTVYCLNIWSKRALALSSSQEVRSLKVSVIHLLTVLYMISPPKPIPGDL